MGPRILKNLPKQIHGHFSTKELCFPTHGVVQTRTHRPGGVVDIDSHRIFTKGNQPRCFVPVNLVVPKQLDRGADFVERKSVRQHGLQMVARNFAYSAGWRCGQVDPFCAGIILVLWYLTDQSFHSIHERLFFCSYS